MRARGLAGLRGDLCIARRHAFACSRIVSRKAQQSRRAVRALRDLQRPSNAAWRAVGRATARRSRFGDDARPGNADDRHGRADSRMECRGIRRCRAGPVVARARPALGRRARGAPRIHGSAGSRVKGPLRLAAARRCRGGSGLTSVDRVRCASARRKVPDVKIRRAPGRRLRAALVRPSVSRLEPQRARPAATAATATSESAVTPASQSAVRVGAVSTGSGHATAAATLAAPISPSLSTSALDTSPINRELSLLAFNRRVLALAQDPDVPLLERLRFLCILGSNLDEYFEIRVAGLKEQLRAKMPPAGMTLSSMRTLLVEISRATRTLIDDQYRALNDQVLPALAASGVRLLGRADRSPAERAWVADFFLREVRPLLTPIGLDPAHPFPQIVN